MWHDMTWFWFDSTWLDSWQDSWHKTEKKLYTFSCSRHTVKLARTRNAICFGSQIGACLPFWHGWRFFALGPTLWGARSFLELLVVVLVRFVERVGLGWVRYGFFSCELWFTAFYSGRPGGELFFFGPDWFPWLGQAGNDYFASFPLHDTPKPAGVFFSRWFIEPYFLLRVYLIWLLIWLADWFIKSKRYFYSRSACFHRRDSQV